MLLTLNAKQKTDLNSMWRENDQEAGAVAGWKVKNFLCETKMSYSFLLRKPGTPRSLQICGLDSLHLGLWRRRAAFSDGVGPKLPIFCADRRKIPHLFPLPAWFRDRFYRERIAVVADLFIRCDFHFSFSISLGPPKQAHGWLLLRGVPSQVSSYGWLQPARRCSPQFKPERTSHSAICQLTTTKKFFIIRLFWYISIRYLIHNHGIVAVATRICKSNHIPRFIPNDA